MAKIKINDIKSIKPAGADLFFDSESFLNELGNDDINMIRGGDWSTVSGQCYSVKADEWSTFSGRCR